MAEEMSREEAADAGYIEVLLDGARGIYLPQSFADRFDMDEWGVSEEDATILTEGPDHEHYDDAWDSVLEAAEHTDKDGHTWKLTQDQDLFAYRSDIDIDWED